MTHIKAISSYTPPHCLHNDTLQVRLPQVDVAKIAKSVGVTERYEAPVGQTASDMAYEAARKMFREWHISPADIDFLLFVTQSADYFLPSTACVLQHRLGLPTSAGAFDIDLGCSGYVYALAVAKSFVSSGLAHNVLLLTGDTITHYLHPEDKNRILFGDGATATLISEEGFAQIGDTVYGTDGGGADSLIMRNRASRHLSPTGRETEEDSGDIRRDDYFYMNGEDIFNFTIDRVPQLITDTLLRNQLQHKDIAHYVLHQANKFMLNTIRKVCGISKDKFYINIEQTGNTTSSTIPIALCDCLAHHTIGEGEYVLLAGFGVGLSWAGTVLRF